MKLPCTERDLCTLLELTGRHRCSIMSPEGPVEYVLGVHALEGSDASAARTSLHEFDSRAPRTRSSDRQPSLQSLRQILHVLLWLDEWERARPVALLERVRPTRPARDDRRAAGRAGVGCSTTSAATRRSGCRAAGRDRRRNCSRASGFEDFKEQFALWWAPFRSGQPLPLSVAGSHVLKGLLWYAALTRDEEVKEIALWLLDVKWKQKRNVEKSMVALEVFGITRARSSRLASS